MNDHPYRLGNDWRCPVQQSAERTPTATAIIAPHRTYTYEDFHAYADGAVDNLRRAGISEGQVMAVALPPGTPYPILLAGLWRLGAIACPLNTRFPKRYLLEILKRLRCRDIVVPYGASIITVQGKLYSLAPKDLVEDQCWDAGEKYHLAADRPATIVLTSGSSGAPKAALLSFGNHCHSAVLSNANIPLGPGDRWLMSLPLHHVSGLGILYRCALGGAAMVFPAADEPMKTSLERYNITHISLVATQLYRLMRDPETVARMRSLKAILLGGGPMPEGLIKSAWAADLPIHTSYGLTEMSTQVATTQPGDPLDRLLTSGRALAPNTLRISPKGTVQVGGAARFLGYVGEDGLQKPFTPDGWFDTGDLGVLDDQEYLHITGRRDNMFISGGENIQPEEIEQALSGAGGVLENLVVPAENAEFGQVPVAFVRTENGQVPAEAIRAFLLGVLPRHKVPKQFFPWPEDFLASGLKVSRKEFADRARMLLSS